METTFWFKLGASFLVGTAWVTLSTIAAERYGSKVGGMIGGLPSTVVVSLLFIGSTQSAQAAARTTTVMPLVQGINGMFILVYLLAVKRGLATALPAALLVWFLAATMLVVLGEPPFWLSVSVWALLGLGCLFIVERVLLIASHGNVNINYTPAQVVVRSLFGGGVISTAVLISRLAGTLFGGIFAIFPAMFASTLVITYRAGGAAFSRAVAKSLMISGMFNVTLYVIAVRYLYPQVGLAAGTILALLFSAATGYLTYQFMKTRLS